MNHTAPNQVRVTPFGARLYAVLFVLHSAVALVKLFFTYSYGMHWQSGLSHVHHFIISMILLGLVISSWHREQQQS